MSLQQQYRDAVDAGFGAGEPAFSRELQRHGGAREREYETDQQGGPEWQLEGEPHARQRRCGQQQLHAAEAEDCVAQLPDTPRLEFETDQKQQKNNSEFSDFQDFLTVRYPAEAPRSNQHAAEQVAGDAAQVQALGQRHEQHGRAEQDDEIDQGGVHVLPVSGAAPARGRCSVRMNARIDVAQKYRASSRPR
jgi:hypothetical protein